MWVEDVAVSMVYWYGARAYAQWLAERESKPWRLPLSLEWEKAARGVDGRWFPWGDYFDPTFCCMQLSHEQGRRLPASVTQFPLDESPYGVRGMAGNARDWCIETWYPQNDRYQDGERVLIPEIVDDPMRERVCRGGAWWQRSEHTRVAFRSGVGGFLRDVGISFRLARSVAHTK